jgi:hypothetical protein
MLNVIFFNSMLLLSGYFTYLALLPYCDIKVQTLFLKCKHIYIINNVIYAHFDALIF